MICSSPFNSLVVMQLWLNGTLPLQHTYAMSRCNFAIFNKFLYIYCYVVTYVHSPFLFFFFFFFFVSDFLFGSDKESIFVETKKYGYKLKHTIFMIKEYGQQIGKETGKTIAFKDHNPYTKKLKDDTCCSYIIKSVPCFLKN